MSFLDDGLVLEPSKKYTQKVEQTFHISQAALDLWSCDSEPIQVVVEYENSNFILATLSRRANIFQVPLDLIFKTGDEVSFRTIGTGKVHLSGYHVLEDVDSMIINGEEESDIDELEENFKGKGKKKKQPLVSKKNKKAKLEDENPDESEDEDLDEEDNDSEDEEEENISVKVKAQNKKQKSDSSFLSIDDEDEDDEEIFEEEEEEEEDEDEDEEEEEEMDVDEFEESDEFSSSDRSDLKKGKLNKSISKKSPQTPNGIASSSKQKGTPSKKLKSPLESSFAKGGKTPKSENKQTSEKKSLSAESTPQRKNLESSKKEEKTPKPKSKDSPQKKVLEGGVISEEIKVGSGPVAKPGKMANVYYVGSLASTKKEFDSVQSGGGFKFRIGRNEVIKGWDIGINGMKVGGKRRLTIPPHLAYGAKGSPPVIPPNSTLVFTVELKGLS